MKGKLKIILIILLMFCFAGCTPKLTYTISGNNISESVEINFGNDFNKKTLEQTLDYYSHRKSLDTSVSIEEVQEGYKGVISSKETSITSYFSNATVLINQCYEDVDFSYKKFEGKYYIKTSTGFQCMVYDYNVVDEISVVVKTHNKVYEHNADEVKNKTYIWNITNDNKDKQSILFVVGDKEDLWYYKYKYLLIGLVAVLSLALIVGIIVMIFKNTSEKANRI